MDLSLDPDFFAVLTGSYRRRLGAALVPEGADAAWLYGQAPFVVLIGAVMPSVLAEISFVTNPQESKLLKTPGYRQHIAEALFDGIAQYQRSLKTISTAANQ